MDKSYYGQPPPSGVAPPPGYTPTAYPPGAYPPGAYPPNPHEAYPPNPHGAYPPNPPATNTVVITGGPTVITQFGPNSQPLICPYCNHSISTKVESKATNKTHLWALLLCLCLCWPCACCPYCMDSCQASAHYCPQCNAYLGQYDN